VDPTLDPILQSRQIRLGNYEDSAAAHKAYFDQLEEERCPGSRLALDELSGDRLTRLEQLVMDNEVRIRSATRIKKHNRAPLELLRVDNEEMSARLNSLQLLIQDHRYWLRYI
jgi:hypothetical protein